MTTNQFIHKFQKIILGFGSLITFYTFKDITFDIVQIKDDEMQPILEKGDIILSSKMFSEQDNIKGKRIFLIEPLTGEKIVRKVHGIAGDWINQETDLFKQMIIVPNGTFLVGSEQNIPEIEKKNPYKNIFFISQMQGIIFYRIYPFNKIGSLSSN